MMQPKFVRDVFLMLGLFAAIVPSLTFAQAEPVIPEGYKLVDDMIVEEDFGTPARGTFRSNLWPGGVVPYEFDANVSQLNQDRSLAAMAEWEAVALVDFIPRTSESNYLHIQSGSSNSSFVGMNGGGQTLNMVSWSVKFIIVHELGHALGLYHEQQRTDRDTYIQVNLGNVQSGTSGNFVIQGTSSHHGDYDFESVMHYGQCSFANCACPSSCTTITVLPPFESFQNVIGQRNQLSNGDAEVMAFLYGALTDCNGNGTLDSQDLSTGVSPDCNNNDIPDECDVLFQEQTGRMSPIGTGSPQNMLISSPPAADGDVTLRFKAYGDFASSNERLDITLNGGSVGSVFTGSASDCPSEADVDELVISSALYNALLAGGNANIVATATSTVSTTVCTSPYITISISYPSTTVDCNLSGTPDECEGDLVIASDPLDAFVCDGELATFDAVAINPGSAAYEWRKGGVPLVDGGDVSGVSSATLNVQNADVSDEGVYTCVVTDGCLSVESFGGDLSIRESLSVAVMGSTSLQECAGETTILALDTTGTDLAYQWYRDGSPLSDGGNISGSNASQLSLTSVSPADAASSPGYECQVSDFCGDLETSTPIELELASTTFSEQPQSTCVSEGLSAEFAATPVPPSGVSLFVQWHKNGSPLTQTGSITGVFTNTLSIDPVTPGDVGDYSLRALAIGPNCVEFSDPATLSVGACGCPVPGDSDDDGDYDLADMTAFVRCFGADTTVQTECACSNVNDANSTVDLDDWALLESLLSGP